MSTDVVTMVQDFIQNLLTDRSAAEQYATDPEGTLAAQGITDHDLSGVDVRQVVGDACQGLSLPDDTRSALQSYSSGGGPSVGGHTPPAGSGGSVEQVVQHLNYVTYTTYQDDHSITTVIDSHDVVTDQSTDISVGGDMGGILSVDSHDNAATGDGAQAIAGDNYGQANTGDGAVQVGDDAGTINTGVNTGVVAGDGLGQAAVGDGNVQAQVAGADHSSLNFGSGSASTNDLSGSDYGDGATIAVDGSKAQGGSVDSHDVTDSGNVTDSFNDSHDSFDSHDVDASYTDNSDHSTDDHSSTDNSYTDNSKDDHSSTDNSTDDHSVDVNNEASVF